MIRWARMSDQTIEQLAALEPVRAALVLRGLLERHGARARCLTCTALYDVHGDLAGVAREPCPCCGGALELAP